MRPRAARRAPPSPAAARSPRRAPSRGCQSACARRGRSRPWMRRRRRAPMPARPQSRAGLVAVDDDDAVELCAVDSAAVGGARIVGAKDRVAAGSLRGARLREDLAAMELGRDRREELVRGERARRQERLAARALGPLDPAVMMTRKMAAALLREHHSSLVIAMKVATRWSPARSARSGARRRMNKPRARLGARGARRTVFGCRAWTSRAVGAARARPAPS